MSFSEIAMSSDSPFDFGDSLVPSGTPLSTSTRYFINNEDLPKIQSAAEQGDVDAMVRLSNHYEMVAQDSENAMMWSLKAAEAGDLESQFAMAIWYLNVGDLSAAERWAVTAKDRGHPHAHDLIEAIRKR